MRVYKDADLNEAEQALMQAYISKIAEYSQYIPERDNSIDAAVICLEIEEISFETTDYVIGEVHKGDGVLAQGFPGSETEIEELLNYVEGTYGRILHNAKDKEVLLWQIEDTHVDSGNRVYELNGFSGSPVWSLEADEKTIVGLFTSGVGRSIYRGKVHALKMEAIRSIMKIFFQIRMESRILGIPNEEIAPQKDNPTYISKEAQPEIGNLYDEWLVVQIEKVRAYIDDVKFQNAIDTAKMAIKDQRFEKCSKKVACTHIKHLLFDTFFFFIFSISLHNLEFLLALLGYRHTKEGELIIQPEEAKTVRFIFLAYIGGYDCDEIAEILTERERPTLRGRTDWNASMVMNVMSNERRWGDLEARKTIVIDYVEHKSKKNEHDRVSAYEEDHHEPIVSREIALAAQMVKKSSRKMTEGVPDFSVIHKGNLKGFVSICPGWGGIDGSALLEICQEVYEEEELEELNHKIRIWSGEEQGKVVSMALSGYQVPHGIYFLNKSLPALTVGRRRIKFSKACHEKLNYCRWVEILYHPIIQTIIIRQTTPDNPNCIEWEKEDGKLVSSISSRAFSTAIYESLHWKKEFSFKFRGITKERGMSKILVFSLDEPQIIVGKKYKNHPDVEKESNQPFGFVKYKTDTGQENKPENNDIVCAYPEEWMKRRIGINYFIREQRDSMINAITEEDIEETGVVVENPVIGHIPSRQEIVNELEELLMTM